MPCLVVIPDAAAQRFHFAAFFFDVIRRRTLPAVGLVLIRRFGRHRGLEDHLGEPGARGLPVLHLAAMLARLEDQAPVRRDPAAIELLEPLLDRRRQ